MDQHPKELVTTGEVGLRSILHEGALYPAFVISTDTESLKSDVVEDIYDRFYYAPFRDVMLEDSAKATVRAFFTLGLGDEFTHSVVLPVSSLLTVMSTMGQDRLQMPFVVVDSAEISEDHQAIGSDCIVFTTGLPSGDDPQFHEFVEKFQDTLGFQVDATEVDENGAEVITVTPEMMEAASQAFASTYLISQGDTGPLMDLIARRDFIDQAQEFVDADDSTLDDEERMEAASFVEMPNVLFSTYHVSANSFMLLEDISAMSDQDGAEEEADDDSAPAQESADLFGSLTQDLMDDILSSINPEDADQPDQLRIQKIMNTWQDSPLASTTGVLSGVRAALLSEPGYQEVLDAAFETTEDLTAAIEIHGRGRVIVALMVHIAERAAKFSLLDQITDPGELTNNDMFNLLQWFDPFGGQFAWKWLALARPLQNYDVTLVEKILRFEQTAASGKVLEENQVIVPTSMIYLAQNVVSSTLILQQWKGYDFSNLADDAMKLEVNVAGFSDFARWIQQLISEAHRIYNESGEDLSAVLEAVQDFIISESVEDAETVAWRVSMALPVLSELCPSVSRYKVGSIQHIRERKEFISAHLMSLAIGG